MRVSSQIKVVAVAALLMSAARSSAATVEFLGLTANSRQIDLRHFGDLRNGEYAGEMNIKVDGQPFIAYCVDLDNDAPNNWQADLLPVNVINGGLAIAYLYDNFAPLVTTPNQGAALQIAIWEVLDDYPGAINVDVNNFQFVGSIPGGQFNNIRTQALAYLAAIPAAPILANYVPQSLIVFSSQVDAAQHMIIPEPASLSMLAFGAVLVVRRSRR